MKALQSTLLHILELIVVIAAVYVISVIFSLTNEQLQILLGLVIAAVVKFARASQAVPIKDYVNRNRG